MSRNSKKWQRAEREAWAQEDVGVAEEVEHRGWRGGRNSGLRSDGVHVELHPNVPDNDPHSYVGRHPDGRTRKFPGSPRDAMDGTDRLWPLAGADG